MKKTKISPFLSLLLVALLLMVPCFVHAEESPLSSNISWNIEGSVLYIEGSGAMELTHEFLNEIPWYHKRDEIDTVVIKEGVTTLGADAFADFTHLKSVTFPSTMTTIGSGAFLTCSRLETLVLPNRLTRIESGAFLGCEQLTSITIPGSVYEISPDAFYNCYHVNIIGIPGSYAASFAKENKLSFSGTLAPLSEILVRVNKNILFFDQPPVIINDRTMVPFRGIFEALGATVEWEAATRTVRATRGDTKISLVIDTNIINKNGIEKQIDVPAQIVGNRTMVPIRAISEALGASVNWDAVTRMVLIED